jgi:hypothetical protein
LPNIPDILHLPGRLEVHAIVSKHQALDELISMIVQPSGKRVAGTGDGGIEENRYAEV